MEVPFSSGTRRRGHQHHPRHATRRRLDITSSSTSSSTTTARSSGPAQCGPAAAQQQLHLDLDATSAETTTIKNNTNLTTTTIINSTTTTRQRQDDPNSNDDDEIIVTLLQATKGEPLSPEHAVARARGDGNSDNEDTSLEEDPELAELAKLRCPSECTEIQAAREARRRKRCADYPGLAFGCSIFASDTMMKFNLIRNELQNIMGNQLKRVSIYDYGWLHLQIIVFMFVYR